jgi:hypothetical protein
MDETKFAGFRTKPSFFAQVKSIGTLENEKKGIKIYPTTNKMRKRMYVWDSGFYLILN